MILHSSPNIVDKDLESVLEQLKSSQIAHGQTTLEFEQLLRCFLDVKYVRTTCNGSYALLIALKALDLEPGSEVILPNYTCQNVYHSVLHAGLKPVLCDLGEAWLVSPESIEQVFTRKTSCIILVHALGMSTNVEGFKKYEVPIIEDFCQNFGGLYNYQQLQLKGDIGIYSFHATKCLTTGEGGAVSTNRMDIIDNIQKSIKMKSVLNPISDLQSSLGISQLKRYPELLLRRKSNADFFLKHINSELTVELRKTVSKNIFFRFLLWKEGVDFLKVKQEFYQKGISVRKGVDSVINTEKRFANSLRALSNTFSIPVHPNLTDENLAKIVDSVNNIL